MEKRVQTQPEETANVVSHGIGILGVLAGTYFLIDKGLSSDTLALIGVLIFCISLLLLYVSSSIYHLLPTGPSKDLFRKLDHIAIFLLIAGTYTPFVLGILRGKGGWTVLAFVWTLAILGIVLELTGRLKRRKYSNILYLAMGWSIVLAIRPLIENVPMNGLILLGVGGLFYSGGVYFYIKDYKPYYHFVWHLFVLAGSACHVFAVLWYA